MFSTHLDNFLPVFIKLLFTTQSWLNNHDEKLRLKTWEKEKMLVTLTSIFSFSHNVFYPIKEKKKHFMSHIFFVFSANASNLVKSKILLWGNESTLPNNKIFNWSKFQAFADHKILAIHKLYCVGRAQNNVGKGEMLVTSIFSFSQNVFKSLLFHRCGNGLNKEKKSHINTCKVITSHALRKWSFANGFD